MKRSETFATNRIWVLNIHIVISSYMFLYTLGVFNPCTDNVAASLSWGSNKDLYVNLFSSFVPVGALVGTIVTGYLIERFGRRTTTMMTDVAYVIGSIILVMPSTETFAIGRLITGFGAGIFMTIGPIYVTEVTPEAMMSKVGPIIVVANNLGLLTAYGLGLALPTSNFDSDPFNYWWLFMFLFPAAVCVYQFFYFKFVILYDTPQYYMGKGMINEANKALGICYTNAGMQGGLRRLNSEVQGKYSEGKMSLVTVIFHKKFRKMVRVGVFLCMLNQLSGMSAIIFYSTSIFTNLGGGIFLSRLLTFIMGIVNLISAIVSVPLLHWFGRKTLLVSGQFLLAVDLILLGIFSGHVNEGVGLPAVFVIIFFFFFSFSLAATLWLYVGEVLNDQVLSISSAFNMGTSVLITFLFPPVSNSIGIDNVFLFFAVMMILGAIYGIFDLVETKDKEKEQILIEMKVMENTVVPNQNVENDSLKEDSEGESQQKEDDKEKELLNEVITAGKNNEISISAELDKTVVSKAEVF